MLSIIAIIGQNRALGKDNKLLWHIPEDLKHFKELTTGHPVIMGRKTYESIGQALPDRRNLIITRNPNFQAPGCDIYRSLSQAIKAAQKESDEVFVIGGGQIYEQVLPFTDKLHLTIVDDTPEADVYFPDYSEFANIIKEETLETDEYKLKFLELTKYK